MKQVIQSFKTGNPRVLDVPVPKLIDKGILMVPRASLVSAGTERMVIDFAAKSLWQKARSRPDLVKQIIDKAKRDGILTTLDTVQNRLDKPLTLGYSCAGPVIDVSSGVSEFKIDDRVACAGGGYAAHAEVVTVPKNLVIKLPENVDYESAAFVTLGAIALQGLRLAETKLGEVVGVIGLGLLGQLTVQMLKAAGCIVIGMDIQPQRAELARRLGADAVATVADQFSAICHQLSAGHGADAILITADATSNEPVESAGEAAREKGIIVAVGSVGLTIPRKVYYEKELDFRISRSYGPGRYDSNYEEKGNDYPYAHVRWTEQRNMEAFGQLLAEGKINVQALITHRFSIDDAPQAYDLITGKSREPFLGVILTYSGNPDLSHKVTLKSKNRQLSQTTASTKMDQVTLGVIGGGNFTNGMLLPSLKNVQKVSLVGIASRNGVSAQSTAERFEFDYCTTSGEDIIDDAAINTVAIVTRHHLHAAQVIAALKARKHVFVEKPLCLYQDELDAIISIYETVNPINRSDEVVSGVRSPSLTVGFNRRFAPFIVELKQHLERVNEPLMLHYRVNAGYVPPDHWTQDPAQGGGRLLGEGCHFIDLLIYLSGTKPLRVTARALPNSGRYSQDNLLIILEFTDGSLGTVSYLANGNKAQGKEYLEVFGGGLSAELDDYRTLTIRSGDKSIKRTARLRPDKGHQAEWQCWIDHLTRQGPAPMSFEEIVLSTEATLAAHLSLQKSESVTLGDRT
ncbi:MAG: Gfo/Idh/MocA family oxidoreductase [Pyrinomonadaceae bacterium]|nr:Gfo/Idh/MocA family oxidoreductase [Pyrinomonadaceae bacterium]